MKPFYRVAKVEDVCPRCETKLHGHAVRMLEFDQRIDTWHDLVQVPPEFSQGWFAFGLKCAKKQNKQAEILLQKSGLIK